jgi:hypothetical protein
MLNMSYLGTLDRVNGVSYSDIDISGYKKTFNRSIHLVIGPTVEKNDNHSEEGLD